MTTEPLSPKRIEGEFYDLIVREQPYEEVSYTPERKCDGVQIDSWTGGPDAILADLDAEARAHVTTERNRLAGELEAAAQDADEYDDSDHALVAVKIRELADRLRTEGTGA